MESFGHLASIDLKAPLLLDAALWAQCRDAEGVVIDPIRVYTALLSSGCTDEVRQEVWPYILGHYRFSDTSAQRAQADAAAAQRYAAAQAQCAQLLLQDEAYRGSDLAFAAQMDNLEYDVARGETQFGYFQDHPECNDILRKVLSAFVSQNRSLGYVQGMSDMLEPLLAVLDDEVLVYSCFTNMMRKISLRFERTNEVDIQFALSQLRAMLTAMDPALMEFFQAKELDHLYFVYRWFLLDFKRDVDYKDIFLLWETIWAARYLLSSGFTVYLAFAALQLYRRDIMRLTCDTEVFSFFSSLPPFNPTLLLAMAKTAVPALASCVMQMATIAPRSTGVEDPALRRQAEEYYVYS